jgi:PIN domain nuclease of toxin-antitoxin system
VKLLLDTHAFLWFINGDENLSSRVRSLMEDDANQKLISIASLWEIAIKNSLGKLMLAEPFDKIIPEQLQLNNFGVLELKVEQ